MHVFSGRVLESTWDSSLFIRTTQHDRVLLLLYMDDMIITDGDADGIQFV